MSTCKKFLINIEGKKENNQNSRDACKSKA
jgi:hypothetical protein